MEQDIFTKALRQTLDSKSRLIVHATLTAMAHILYQLRVVTLFLELMYLAMAMELQAVGLQEPVLQPIRCAGQDVMMQTFWLVLKLP